MAIDHQNETVSSSAGKVLYANDPNQDVCLLDGTQVSEYQMNVSNATLAATATTATSADSLANPLLISQVTNLQSMLDNLTTLVNGKANVSHTHSIAEVDGLQADLNAIEQDILNLQTGGGGGGGGGMVDLGPIQTRLSAVETDISVLTNNLTILSNQQTTNITNIGTLTTQQQANTSNITTIQNQQTADATAIAQNTSGRTTNASSISTNATNIQQNADDIAQNANDIASIGPGGVGPQGDQGIGIQGISAPANPMPGTNTTITVALVDPSGDTTPANQTFVVPPGAMGMQGPPGTPGGGGGSGDVTVPLWTDMAFVENELTRFGGILYYATQDISMGGATTVEYIDPMVPPVDITRVGAVLTVVLNDPGNPIPDLTDSEITFLGTRDNMGVINALGPAPLTRSVTSSVLTMTFSSPGQAGIIESGVIGDLENVVIRYNATVTRNNPSIDTTLWSPLSYMGVAGTETPSGNFARLTNSVRPTVGTTALSGFQSQVLTFVDPSDANGTRYLFTQTAGTIIWSNNETDPTGIT